MKMFRFLALMAVLLCAFGFGPGSLAQDKSTRQAAEKLMQTLGLEKRVDSVVQIYLQVMPQAAPEDAARARQLRERAPGAGQRFQTAVARAAARSFSRNELQELDRYFASDDGQRLITTALGRAIVGVMRGGNLKTGDLLRSDDFAAQPGLARVADKYPAFEAAARNELGVEFAQEIALLVLR